MCIKTFTKQDLDILGYQFVIHENMNFAEYQMSHKGAAGKGFSAYMPVNKCIFRVNQDTSTFMLLPLQPSAF